MITALPGPPPLKKIQIKYYFFLHSCHKQLPPQPEGSAHCLAETQPRFLEANVFILRPFCSAAAVYDEQHENFYHIANFQWSVTVHAGLVIHPCHLVQPNSCTGARHMASELCSQRFQSPLYPQGHFI